MFSSGVGAVSRGMIWVGRLLRSNVLSHVGWSLAVTSLWAASGIVAAVVSDPGGRSAGYALGMATAVGLFAWLLLLILGAPLNAVIAIATGVALRTGRWGRRGVGVAIGSAVWGAVTLLWLSTRSTLTPDQILSGERPADAGFTLVSAIACGVVFGLLVRGPGQGVVLRMPTPPPPVTPRA